MKPKLKDSARPKMYLSPAAAAAAASVTAAYSYSSGKQLDFTRIEDTTAEGASQKQDGFAGTTSTKDSKRLLELSLAEVREENSMLKGKVDEINNNHEELSKVFAAV